MTATASRESRDRLARVRERARQARADRARALEAVELARKGGDQDAEAIARTMAERAQAEEEMASQLENTLLSQIAGTSGGYGVESAFDDPQTVEGLERLAHSSMPVGRLDLGPLCSREEYIAKIESGSWGSPRLASNTPDVPETSPARYGPYYGVVPQPRRRLRLLDLIPASPMDGASFDYTQETGSFDTAAETGEGSLKPGADVTLTDASVKARTVAHWFKLKRQQLSDVPSLATAAESRLIYGVNRRLENQIVGGDGTGENLLGILNTSGIASVAFTSVSPLTDLTLDGITDVL